MQNPLGAMGLIIIALFALVAFAHPVLMSTVWDEGTYDPFIGFDATVPSHPSQPSWKHLLGTDATGRDVLSRVIFAARTSFGVGIISALIGTAIASLIGVTAAYYGGKTDAVLMMLADTFIMLPPAVVLLTVGLIFKMNLYHVGLLYGLFAGLGSLAILIKTHVLSILPKQYIQAARVVGRDNFGIIRLHVIPNLFGLMTVNMMFVVTGSVMVEALLSFMNRTDLRLSWGTMIWETLFSYRGGSGLEWHVLLPPAVAIMLFCGAFYLVARTLDEVVNPALRQR